MSAFDFTGRDCAPESPDAIDPIDFEDIDCDFPEVPRIPIGPDQREVVRNPILRPRISAARAPGCIPDKDPEFDPNSVSIIGDIDFEDCEEDTSVWEAPNYDSDTIISKRERVVTRQCFTKDDGLNIFYREHWYDSCNFLVRITGETKVTLAVLGPCPPES